jgi:RNA polymerase sigma-70 factor (ECF subfamily)
MATEPSADVEDGALVMRARRGDTASFEALVRRHLRGAHAVAAAVLGDAWEADDVCQDAWLSALRNLERCDPPEKFRVWFTAIVRNRALDVRRRRIVRAAEPLDDEVLPSASAGPQREAERADLRQRLIAAMATLTETQREILRLHDIEGWKHAEIGALLGLADSTVRVHLANARRAMRARLASTMDVRDHYMEGRG